VIHVTETDEITIKSLWEAYSVTEEPKKPAVNP
jgi:hypothetical protein